MANQLCQTCQVPAHDVCSMTDGCPCCQDTMERMNVDTVTVWVMPHDDPGVGWVVNDIHDMELNYLDMGGNAPGSFQGYLDSWTSLEMPRDLWIDGDGAAQNAWVERQVN